LSWECFSGSATLETSWCPGFFGGLQI